MAVKNEICVIGIYFGTFPPYFNLWLKSCLQNPKIDFLIFTDNGYAGKTIGNVRFEKSDLEKMRNLFQKKLDMEVALKRPYKCCDFRPAYGIIFEEYLKTYAYWGHCDFDMIFGDIFSFAEKYEYKKYDKFLPMGHLSLYRNTEACNNYFRMDGGAVSFKEAFQEEKSAFFDELRGIDRILKKHGIPLFERRIFADISRLYHRFRLALDDVNYKNQVFYWEDGKLYRAFLDGEAVFTEEFLYIHFSGRKLGKADFDEEAAMAFFISPEGFCLKEKGCPSKTEILTNNRFPGKIQEAYERNRAKLIFKWKRLKSRI